MAADWKLVVVNFFGVIYTVTVIAAIAVLNINYTCPAVCGEGNCKWPVFYAIFILSQIVFNLILFHYFNKRNQISYWRVKSNSLLQENIGGKKSFVTLNICSSQQDNELEHQLSFSNTTNQTILEKRGTLIGRRKDLASHYYHSPTSSPLVPTFEGSYYPYPNSVAMNDCDSATRSSTRFCVECGTNTPRRAHHCPLCGICILRKDHHCFITGGCVGLANQRYFIVFLFWASIGTAYGAYFNFSYLDKFVVAEWLPFNWIFYVGPVSLLRWLLGMEILFNTILIVMLTISVSSFLGLFGFLCAQMFYTLNGYTMYDYHVGRFKEKLESDGDTLGERLALVFGRRWWLNFIVPQFWLPNEMTPAMVRNIFISESKDL